MIKLFFTTVLLIVISQAHCQFPKTATIAPNIDLCFHRNIEFLGFAYFLGYESQNSDTRIVEINGKEVLEKDWQQYGYHVFLQYQHHLSNNHLQEIFALSEHLWLDYLSSFLLQVGDFPNAQLTPGTPQAAWIRFSPDQNQEEARKNAEAFLFHCNAFYKECAFENYLDTTGHLYAAALQQVQENLPEARFVTAMESFYRKEFHKYTVIPSLLLPKEMGFGPHIQRGDSSLSYCIFGAVDFQSFHTNQNLDMGFGKPTILWEKTIHEFGHSFVNPEIYRVPDSLIEQSSDLFIPIREAMENQGYNSWRGSIIEHFVRAGEIVIARQEGETEHARYLTESYMDDRRFIYLPVILRELALYRNGLYSTYQEMVLHTFSELRQFASFGQDSILHPTIRYPRKANFHTEDIALFWTVFDKTSPRFSGNLLDEEYLNKGSAGLRAFIPMRIESGRKLGKTLRQNRGYYTHIRDHSLRIVHHKNAFYAWCEQLQFLYPEAVFPDVYFVIGRNNTGGTTFKGGLIIGAERFGPADNLYKPALPEDKLEQILIHELIHYQQKYVSDKSLLAQCIREGAADFLCELVTGMNSSSPEMYTYGWQHEGELWNAFQLQKDQNDWSGWLYHTKTDNQPKDLGYWIGYAICRAYYDKTENKQQAIRDILNINDFNDFLVRSGYNGKSNLK